MLSDMLSTPLRLVDPTADSSLAHGAVPHPGGRRRCCLQRRQVRVLQCALFHLVHDALPSCSKHAWVPPPAAVALCRASCKTRTQMTPVAAYQRMPFFPLSFSFVISFVILFSESTDRCGTLNIHQPQHTFPSGFVFNMRPGFSSCRGTARGRRRSGTAAPSPTSRCCRCMLWYAACAWVSGFTVCCQIAP